MITLYSGTPRSGKSLHSAKDIVTTLNKCKTVIANFVVNTEYISKKPLRIKLEKLGFKFKDGQMQNEIGEFIYKDNADLTVAFLVQYARKNHIIGKEGQTLLVIDECSIQFNPREFGRKDRAGWIKFFQHHGKLGYNIILITQNDRLLDRQVRSFIEYNVIHRKVNNFKIGWVLSLMHIGLFCAITYWYGVREKCGSEFFKYKNYYSKVYDSYAMFDDSMLDDFAPPKLTDSEIKAKLKAAIKVS